MGKISSYSNASSLADANYLLGNQSGPTTKKFLLSDLAAYYSSKVIGQAAQVITFIPVGNSDYSSGSVGTWVTMGNATVPSWATKAKIVLTIRAFLAITSTATASANVSLGGVAGAATLITDTNYAANEHLTTMLVDEITLSGTGSQSLIVQAQRTGGSGALRSAAGVTIFSALILYS